MAHFENTQREPTRIASGDELAITIRETGTSIVLSRKGRLLAPCRDMPRLRFDARFTPDDAIRFAHLAAALVGLSLKDVSSGDPDRYEFLFT